MKEECCLGLKRLKKEYEQLKDKYSLPDFQEMNYEFEIEKLQDKETETLAREIRRLMSEKNTYYLKFIEMFLNPGAAPMFFLALVKNMNHVEKKLLEDLYNKLGRNEILSLKLDNKHDEKKEAEFIKKFYKEWQEIKEKFGEVLKVLEESWERKSEQKEKGYLG